MNLSIVGINGFLIILLIIGIVDTFILKNGNNPFFVKLIFFIISLLIVIFFNIYLLIRNQNGTGIKAIITH